VSVDRDLAAAIAVTRFGLGARPGEIAEALAYKSPVEVAALRAVRAALDPGRIMNPRVLF
jgi:FAD/FMN-containing dehydrogenase